MECGIDRRPIQIRGLHNRSASLRGVATNIPELRVYLFAEMFAEIEELSGYRNGSSVGRGGNREIGGIPYGSAEIVLTRG